MYSDRVSLFTEYSPVVIPVFLLFLGVWTYIRYQILAAKDRNLALIYSIALPVSIAAGVSMAAIYQLYYGGGDTFTYNYGARSLVRSFWQEPFVWIQLMLNDFETAESIFRYQSSFGGLRNLTADLGNQNYFTSKITSIFGIPAFGDYFGTCALLNIVKAETALFFIRSFGAAYPSYQKPLLFAVYFVPSVFFWGSGIGKDIISIIGVLVISATVLKLLQTRKLSLSIISVIFIVYFTFQVRAFIVLSLIAGLAFFIIVERSSKLKNPFVRLIFLLVIVPSTIIGSIYLLVVLSAQNKRYDVNRLAEQVYIQNHDLTSAYYYYNTGGGSVYDIGEFEPTPAGLISKFPITVYTTLFRPHPWEARNILSLITSVEITFFGFIFLYVVIVVGPIQMIRRTFSNPMLLFFLVYTLFMAFFLGLTSGNFGNLTRYRSVTLIFWVAYLLSFYFQYRDSQKEWKQQQMSERKRLLSRLRGSETDKSSLAA